MRLLDTVVLIGAIRKEDRHHKKARKHLDSLSTEGVFIPSSTIIEFDLELKAHGYTPEEREVTLEEVAAKIPPDKTLPTTATSLIEVARLESKLSYFDAMIVAAALELGAEVVTTDREIKNLMPTVW